MCSPKTHMPRSEDSPLRVSTSRLLLMELPIQLADCGFCVSVRERADRLDGGTDTPAERKLTGSRILGLDGMPRLLRLPVGLRQSSPQHLGEHDGVVVLGVTRGVDEGKRALAGLTPELR
jgi:hypothetical protein